MGFKVKGNPGVIRIDEEVHCAIERDRRKDETPNMVLRRWLGIDPPRRSRRSRAGSAVIRIDGEVRHAIEADRRKGETPSNVIRKRLGKRRR